MTLKTISMALLLLVVGVTTTLAGPSGNGVALRSGVIKGDRETDAAALGNSAGPQRWVVRFQNAPGMFERGRLQVAGARIEAPLPGQAFLVTLPVGAAGADLSRIPGIDWATPFLPQDKIAPDIAAVSVATEGGDDVIVMLQLFKDADPVAVASELQAEGLQVTGTGSGSRFDRIVLLMSPDEVASHREGLAARNDVFWVGRRYGRTLQNDTTVWVNQSGLDAGMTTPVFDHGIYGEGQIAAVLDTGLDADMCYFRDGSLGLPPTNTGGGTTVDLNQRKVIAVDFLDPAENPANPADWDTHGHGSHVTGTLVGDDLANPVVRDTGDGMAPGAKIVVQDGGFANDNCGDLPGIGCPVTDLVPIFQQAYDQGARVHNNSWNDNENAQVQNTYTDASEDVDEFTWNNPDFLVFFGAGNQGLGGAGTIGSPGTAKNCMAVGATYTGEFANNLADVSSWGPTDDGRIKPDVLSPGQAPWSADGDFDVTTDNCAVRSSSGTSMASPGAAGSAVLVRQYFSEGWYPTGAANAPDGFNPTAALVKAMLINSATPIMWDNFGNAITVPSDPQGWGRVLLDDAMHFVGDNRGLYVDEYSAGFTSPTDPPVTYLLEVQDPSEPVKVTLVWSDFPSTPAATTHLVNDLDLRVDGPDGSWWGNSYRDGTSWNLGVDPDRLNNVEQVYVPAVAGVYSIQVQPHAIPAGPQPFALVVTGGAMTVTAGPRPSYWTHAVDDSGPGGNGDGILDPGERALIPITLRNSGDADATTVLGDLYSALPDTLKVYGGTASYSDIAVNAQETSTAPHFEVVLEPSASCGDWIGSTVGVAGDGFEVSTGFTLEIGTYEKDYPSTDTPIGIPTNDTVGVYSFLEVPDSFPVTEVDVTVNIDHRDIGDVRVVLYHPDNSLVFLHNFGDAGVSDIHTTYDDLTEPAMGTMETFLGKDPQGTWRMRVIDNANGQSGTLENWTLHFKGDTPFNCNPVGCGEAVPPAVGDTLMTHKAGASDVDVTWTGVGGASDYNVWRSATKQLTTATHLGASGGATSRVDPGGQTLPGAHYYVVRSVNTCGWESP